MIGAEDGSSEEQLLIHYCNIIGWYCSGDFS
jgi:hypothetical protein